MKRELASLRELLGDTRVRFRQGLTLFASAEKLIEVDLEIRSALSLSCRSSPRRIRMEKSGLRVPEVIAARTARP